MITHIMAAIETCGRTPNLNIRGAKVLCAGARSFVLKSYISAMAICHIDKFCLRLGVGSDVKPRMQALRPQVHIMKSGLT